MAPLASKVFVGCLNIIDAQDLPQFIAAETFVAKQFQEFALVFYASGWRAPTPQNSEQGQLSDSFDSWKSQKCILETRPTF